MKVKTRELTSAALDWAVAKADGRGAIVERHLTQNRIGVWLDTGRCTRISGEYIPSTSWDQAGAIIERGEIAIVPTGDGDRWKAYVWDSRAENFTAPLYGPTALIAAMRCYVAAKLGETIDIPDLLVTAPMPVEAAPVEPGPGM